MSKTILVGKDMVQMDIYSLNLRAFVGTEVTILNSAEKVGQFLDLDSSVDLIISQDMIKDEKTANIVCSIVKEKELSIPVCVIGKVENKEDFLSVFATDMNLKDLVRFVAKTFDVTAKDMIQMNVGEYYSIPINYFIELKGIACDIFTRISLADGSYQYDRKCRKGETFNQNLLEEYMIKGVQNLYILSSERLKFTNDITTKTFESLKSADMPAHERISTADRAMKLTAREVKSIGLNEQTADMAKICIASIEKTITDYPKLKGLLERLLNSEESWLYKYCQILTYVTNHMVAQTDWGSKEQIEKLNFAIFFQDLDFLARDLDAEKLVPILNNADLREAMSEGLTDEEQDAVENHAIIASNQVKDIPITPFEVDVIIKQHHGSYSGSGFPDDIQGNISHLAQLLVIAQDFTIELLAIEDVGMFNPRKLVKKIQLRYKKQRMKKFVESLETITF